MQSWTRSLHEGFHFVRAKGLLCPQGEIVEVVTEHLRYLCRLDAIPGHDRHIHR